MSVRIEEIKKDRDKVRDGKMTKKALSKKWEKSSAKRIGKLPRREK